jgi:hypothetical protein
MKQLLLICALEYGIEKIKRRFRTEWDTSPFFCADDVNLLDKNVNIVKKNTEALLVASKDGGLEVNREKT